MLESIEGGETWGRYSFLGYDPIMRVTCRSNEVVVEKKGKQEIYQTEKPLEIIREIMKDYRSPKLEGMPPFTGGFVGYFAYSMIGYAEPGGDEGNRQNFQSASKVIRPENTN